MADLFAVQIDARSPDIDRGMVYGLEFGYDQRTNSSLILEVVPSRRSFALVRTEGDNTTVVVPEEITDALATDETWNRLRVERRDDEVRLYANGKLLGSYDVPQNHAGLTGMMAGTIDNRGGRGVFRQLPARNG